MGVLIIDGARAGRQSPKDKNVREASIGGRRNIPSRYALACTGKIGGALWLGKAKHGRKSDKGAPSEGEFGFGKWTGILHAKRAAPRDRFALLWNPGFPGAEDAYPGQVGVRAPCRRQRRRLAQRRRRAAVPAERVHAQGRGGNRSWEGAKDRAVLHSAFLPCRKRGWDFCGGVARHLAGNSIVRRVGPHGGGGERRSRTRADRGGARRLAWPVLDGPHVDAAPAAGRPRLC